VVLIYSLSATVYFHTTSQGYSNTAIDNIFIDTYKFINFTFSPLRNGLSDHDAQVLKIINVNLVLQKHPTYTIRNINNYSIEEFKTRLSYKPWDSIFSCNGYIDTDTLFNLFHNVICFLWVIPRRHSAHSRRFGTLYQFHLHRQVDEV